MDAELSQRIKALINAYKKSNQDLIAEKIVLEQKIAILNEKISLIEKNLIEFKKEFTMRTIVNP